MADETVPQFDALMAKHGVYPVTIVRADGRRSKGWHRDEVDRVLAVETAELIAKVARYVK